MRQTLLSIFFSKWLSIRECLRGSDTRASKILQKNLRAQRSMKRKETRVDIYRSKNHCSLVSSPDLPYCMCTVIEFTPGEGILDLLSFDNYYRSPLFASSYSIRVFFLFFFFFLRFFSLSDSQPDFQFVKIGFFPLIYFTITQLLLVNTWKSYRTRGDNHFNSIRMERWRYIYIFLEMNNLKIKYYWLNEFPCVILRITIKNSKF